jgi:hypothetical protein
VGDAACAKCHAEIAAAYRSHPMGRSMAYPSAAALLADGDLFEADGLTYSAERRDGRVFHQESLRDPKGNTIAREEAEVRYVLGSGKRGLSFLVERGGRLYQSPISWYAQAKRWDLAPGYHEANQHFDRSIPVDCLFCHTNRVAIKEGKAPEFFGLTIGCERCHGPGELHIRRPERIEGQDLTMVNPADLRPTGLREAVCEQCHLQATQRTVRSGHSPFEFRPGLPLETIFQVSTADSDPSEKQRSLGQVGQMHESRCYQASGGRLGCISCHDPHRLPDQAERVAYYRTRCLECHAKLGCSLPAASRLAMSPDDDCTSCHMPRSLTTDIAHTSQTQHSIPRRAETKRR